MCGIAGIVSTDRKEEMTNKVNKILSLISHRGPDDKGIWCGENVCLGHHRLSIIDLSEAAHQPMTDGERYVLVYNGEIYNYKDLRKELQKMGMAFKSHSDTEVLLLGYKVWGYRILDKIKGFFAFALWDIVKGELWCVRDPFGKKPLYFFCRDNKFIFSSEVESLVAVLDRRPSVDNIEVFHYLWKGYISPGKSIYQSVNMLEAGHCLVYNFRRNEYRQWCFRELKFRLGKNSYISYAKKRDLYEELRQKIALAVERRFQSDVPVGVLLSGGVDSSLVSLFSAERLRGPINTFTATFENSKFNEALYAQMVVRKIHSNHREVKVNMQDIPTFLPQLVRAYGEPFGDESAIPTYHLFKAIKPYIKVALTGDGGDELFGGYKDLRLCFFRGKFKFFVGIGNFMNLGELYRLTNSKWRKLRELSFILISLRSDFSSLLNSLFRGGWSYEWSKCLMRKEVFSSLRGDEIYDHLKIKDNILGRSSLESYLNFMLERLTQCFLVKIDRASMAHSIEARCPLLDIDLFEEISKFSSFLLFPGQEPKGILKKFVGQKMGYKFSHRKKMGFTPPLSEWMRQPIAMSWIEQQLTSKRSFVYSLFRQESIRYLLNQHIKGYDHSGRLWKLLFLNAWYEHYYGKA